MAEQQYFPDTSFIDNLFGSPLQAQLVRTVYLAEDCSGGSEWLRESIYAEGLMPYQLGFSRDQLIELPAALEAVNKGFEKQLAADLVALGGLSASAPTDRMRQNRSEGIRALWNNVCGLGDLDITEFAPLPHERLSVRKKMRLSRMAGIVATMVSGIVLADVASLRDSRAGRGERSESIFQSAALNGQLTGVPALDTFFTGLRQLALIDQPKHALSLLEAEWPADAAEPFYPAQYLKEYSQVPGYLRWILRGNSKKHARAALQRMPTVRIDI